MGLFAKIAGQLVGGPVLGAAEGIANVIDRFVETPEEKQAAALVLEKLRQRANEVQVEVNKIEAGHRSLFVAGWRPFVGWVAGVGLMVPFIVNPVLQWVTGDPGPQMPIEHLMPLVIALLGLGAYRSWEKDRGRAK